MEKRKLGALSFNPVGLGCMGFSHAYGAAVEKSEAIKTIRAAHELGYDFFDTAECYTGENFDGTTSNNEELVGEALKTVRDEVVIATKFGVAHNADRSLTLDSSPDTIRKSVDGSLKRLGVETIDLYYQHRIDPKVEPEVVAEVMSELIKVGKIRAWGISEANEDYLRRAHKICAVTAIQNRYAEKNSTPAQISLAWMLCKKPYIIPIPGSRKLSRLKENFAAGEILLSPEEISAIDSKLGTMEFEIFGGSPAK